MILVKAAPGLVMELTVGPSGTYDTLSVKLSPAISAAPLTFLVSEVHGRLAAQPLEQRPLSELVAALGALLANEAALLAEVRKYRLGP